jgi:diguanylate cyclase (GGDEF)-like protein/PAS domain S-box-containing protein
MGLAVTAMHYTGMSAAHFFPVTTAAPAHVAGMAPVQLASLVVGAILVIVAIAVASVVMDYRLAQLKDAAKTEATKFAHLLEAVPDGIIGVSREGQIKLSNSRVGELFRYGHDVLLGKPVDLLLPGGWGGSGARPFPADRRAALVSRIGLQGRRADQSEFPAEVSVKPIATPEGPLLICAIRDVTEQETARQALRETNERLREGMAKLEAQSEELRLLTEMGELLHSCEAEQEAYDIISMSVVRLLGSMPGAVYMLSRSRNVLQSTATWGAGAENFAPVLSPDECWALRRGRLYAVTGREGAVRCKHVGAREAYACVPMLAHGEVLGVLHVVASGNDRERSDELDSAIERKRILLIAIAEKIASAVANLRLREELRNQSIRDPLTGLLNRRFMEEAFEREIVRANRTATSLSVVAIDLDHFKRFNDLFGHEGGDLVLREVGAAMARMARGDNLACRLGGEELLLILPDTTLEHAMDVAEKLRRKIERLSVVLRGQQLGKITASLGVAEYPRHGDTHNDVLRAADRALYRAKAAGRNRVTLAERADDTTVITVARGPSEAAP